MIAHTRRSGASLRAFGNAMKCCVCMEHFEQPHQLPCSHMLCHVCAVKWLQVTPTCPMCKEEANRRSIEHHGDLEAIVEQYRECLLAFDQPLMSQDEPPPPGSRAASGTEASVAGSVVSRVSSPTAVSADRQPSTAAPSSTVNDDAFCEFAPRTSHSPQTSHRKRQRSIVNSEQPHADDGDETATGEGSAPRVSRARSVPQSAAAAAVEAPSLPERSEGSDPMSVSVSVRAGDVIEVLPRMWPGSNKPGGAAWAKAIHDNATVDVEYVLDRRREKAIDLRYIQPSEYMSEQVRRFAMCDSLFPKSRASPPLTSLLQSRRPKDDRPLIAFTTPADEQGRNQGRSRGRSSLGQASADGGGGRVSTSRSSTGSTSSRFCAHSSGAGTRGKSNRDPASGAVAQSDVPEPQPQPGNAPGETEMNNGTENDDVSMCSDVMARTDNHADRGGGDAGDAGGATGAETGWMGARCATSESSEMDGVETRLRDPTSLLHTDGYSDSAAAQAPAPALTSALALVPVESTESRAAPPPAPPAPPPQHPRSKSKKTATHRGGAARASASACASATVFSAAVSAGPGTGSHVDTAAIAAAAATAIATSAAAVVRVGARTTSISAAHAFAVGDTVHVDARHGPGMNKPGGAARVTAITAHGYSVKYIVTSGMEHSLSEGSLSFMPLGSGSDSDASASSGHRHHHHGLLLNRSTRHNRGLPPSDPSDVALQYELMRSCKPPPSRAPMAAAAASAAGAQSSSSPASAPASASRSSSRAVSARGAELKNSAKLKSNAKRPSPGLGAIRASSDENQVALPGRWRHGHGRSPATASSSSTGPPSVTASHRSPTSALLLSGAKSSGQRPCQIVSTGLPKEAQQQCKELAKQLGGTYEEHMHPSSTTHIVVQHEAVSDCAPDTPIHGRPIAKTRTLKYMEGVLAGNWIVSQLWVSECLAKHEHVPEERYEITGDSKGCTRAGAPRRAREARARGDPPLFDGLRFRLNLPPKRSDLSALAGLIKSGGGTVVAHDHASSEESDSGSGSGSAGVTMAKGSVIVISSKSNTPGTHRPRRCVNEDWIFDSISNYEIMR